MSLPVKPAWAAVASEVDATVAVVVVAAMNAVIVQKAARMVAWMVAPKIAMKAVRKAEAMSALTAVTNSATRSRATLSRVANNEMSSEVSSAVNNEARAKSSASHAPRVSHVKVAAPSAHAVSAANAMNGAVSSARQWMPPSRILPWPTRPPWQRPWAARHWMLAKMPRAVNVVNVVAATTAALSHAVNHVKIARPSVMQPPNQQQVSTQTPQPKTRYKQVKATQLTSNAHHVDVATAMAVNAASATTAVKVTAKELSAIQTVLKPLFLLRIQYQMGLQHNKFERKKLLNL